MLSQAQQLAFPGATGFGKYTKGGRGGKVIYVDNLNDDGPGSFRDAVEQSGPRTIVFRVSGTINLVDGLVIKNPYITIAGQTAPGDGILLKGGTIFIQTSEVIIRNIRIRKGADRRGDGIGIEAAGKELYNIILDHCSISWASDENIGINGKNGGLRDVTIQHSILGEGIMDHSMGLLANKKLDGIGPDYISIHNNFFISNHERNPTIGSGITATVINNIVHNWKYKGSEYHSFSKGDIMYNKFKRGQDTRGVHRAIEMSAGSNVYLKGNDLPEGMDVTSGDDSDKSNAPYYDNSVYGFAPMTNMSALETYVLENSGAYPLDEVDVRYVSEYKNGTGKMIYNESEAGGFPSLSGGSAPADSDKDGMSDEWELEQGLNPNSFDANGDIDGDGYTNLEEYLNCLMGECGSNSGSNPDENAAPQISNISNQTIDQDNSTSALAFTVSDDKTNASQLVVTSSSSNKTLVDAAGIELAGTNANRTIRVTPNAGEIGTTTITVRVSDGEKSSSTRFDVIVRSTSGTESFGITSLILINADNGTKIADLSDGVQFSTSQLPTDNLTIEANTFGQEAISVVFDWQGQTNFRTENVAPFTLFGDKDGTYEFQKFGVGSYEIAATAFTQEDGQGNASKTTTIRFGIVEGTTNNTAPTISSIHNQTIDQDNSTPALSFRISDNETNASQLVVTASSSNKTLVNAAGIELAGTNADRTIRVTPNAGEIGTTTITVRVSDGEKSASTRFDVTVKETSTTESFGIASLVLINADNGTRITDLSPGMEFSTNDLPTDNLTIEANTFGQEAISVVFDWQGQTNFKTENVAPFTLFGDKDGTYEFQKMGVGTYEIAATAFTQEDGQGNASKTKVIRFTIVEDNSSAPAEGINVNAGDDFEWNIANGPFEVRARWDDIPDAYVTSIKWTKVSGPSIKMITDDRASLEVSQIQVGTYKFKVYVTDSKGRSGTDDIVVDVVEEAGNNNIHVYAGDDFEWESSNGTLELLARWDNIPDAFITNIRWEKVSGDWVRMEDTDRAKVRIINPKQGTYTFQVTITDSKNRTASDDITVQVNNSITSSLNLTDDLVVRNEIPVQRNYLVTNNQVTMQLSTDKQFFIQLIDLSGHEVYSDDFSGQLKTGSLARGMYIYHVMDEDGNLFQKGFILKN